MVWIKIVLPRFDAAIATQFWTPFNYICQSKVMIPFIIIFYAIDIYGIQTLHRTILFYEWIADIYLYIVEAVYFVNCAVQWRTLTIPCVLLFIAIILDVTLHETDSIIETLIDASLAQEEQQNDGQDTQLESVQVDGENDNAHPVTNTIDEDIVDGAGEENITAVQSTEQEN